MAVLIVGPAAVGHSDSRSLLAGAEYGRAVTQADGVWSAAYSCQTDLFTVSAQNPRSSHYEVEMDSLIDGQWSPLVKVRELTVTGPMLVNWTIPMAEAESTFGVPRSIHTEIAVVDTLNGSEVVTGTVVNTVGCPREPDPTVTPGTPVVGEPPSDAPPAVQPKTSPTVPIKTRPTQKVRLPKKSYKVGKKIRLPRRTQAGAPVIWSTFPSWNPKHQHVCVARSRFIREERGRPLERSTIRTLHPGRCRYQVYSDGYPGDEVLAMNGTFRVKKR